MTKAPNQINSSLGTVTVSSARVSLHDLAESDCLILYEIWDKHRGDRFAPTWQEFDLSYLPANCIQYTHVVDVSTEPFDITFRVWGTGLTDVLYFDRTGQSLLTTNMGYLDEHRREQVLSDYRAVISSKEPMPFLWDASSTREHSRRLIVPSIRLPLSEDNNQVTGIITHFDFASQDRAIWEKMFEVNNRRAK